MTVIILASILMGVASATTAGLLLAMLQGHLTSPGSATALLLGVVVGYGTFFFYRSRDNERLSFGPFEWVVSFCFLLLCFRQFFWLYYYKNGEMYTLLLHNWGDIAIHLTYINNFVEGAAFWPEHPIATGEPLTYPFGVDLFTAMWVKIGVPNTTVLPVMGFCFGLLVCVALLFWGRGFAVAAFLFSTGIAGYEALGGGVLKDYQSVLPWKSLPLTLLIPQRGFLYGFSAGLLLLWSWRARFLRDDGRPLPQPVEGLLWGLMPLFHLHTFLFLSSIFALWTVGRGKIKAGIPIVLWAVVPATLEVLALTDLFQRTSVVSWKAGWVIGQQNPLLFLLTNFGFLIPLLLFAVRFSLSSRNAEHRWLLFPGLLLWTVFFFVMFAPWDWDNIKMMAWAYLLLVPVLGTMLQESVRPPWRAAVYVVLFFSGGVSLYSEYRPQNGGLGVVRVEEFDAVCQALKTLPDRSRVATEQGHNHPVVLCGYPLAVGFGGWLWSHGIQAAGSETKLKQLMTGHADWKRLASDLQARYIFWGPREQNAYKDSTRPWEGAAARVASGNWGAIYDLGLPP